MSDRYTVEVLPADPRSVGTNVFTASDLNEAIRHLAMGLGKPVVSWSLKKGRTAGRVLLNHVSEP